MGIVSVAKQLKEKIMPHAFPKLVHVSPVSVPMWVKFKVDGKEWTQPVISWGLVESDEPDPHRWIEPLVSAREAGKAHAVYAKKAHGRDAVVGLFLDSDGSLEA